eukprot:g1131.t1
MSFDYVALDVDPDDFSVSNTLGRLARPYKAAAGVAGLLLTVAAGWLADHRFNFGRVVGPKTYTKFYPLDSIDKVVVQRRRDVNDPKYQPGPPSLLQMSLKKEISCIFSYAIYWEDLLSTPGMFEGSEFKEPMEAWIYGAAFKVKDMGFDDPHGKPLLGAPTGSPNDVIKGWLLCYPLRLMKEKLAMADRLYLYNPTLPDDGLLRRGLASTVLEDGSVKTAYWYYTEHKCPQCNEAYPTKVKLRNHLRDVHNVTTLSLFCPEPNCNFSTTSEIVLREHMFQQHIKQKPYSCALCNGTFVKLTNYKQHLRTHSEVRPFKCTECPKAFRTLYDLNVHMKLHRGDNAYQCRECDRVFGSFFHLDLHVAQVHGPRTYSCPQCDEKFDLTSALNAHIYDYHNKENFSCPLCPNMTWPHATFLVDHWKKVHKGRKGRTPTCRFCGRIFLSKEELYEHAKSHKAKKKKFECDFCAATFRTQPQLQTHMKIHTNEKPFKCGFCGKGFNQKPNLRTHERSHTGELPFKCTNCTKHFSTRQRMNDHFRRFHTNDKPWACHMCNKSFVTANERDIHFRVHTGEKPFQCDICQTNFTQRSNLRTHMRRKHPELGLGPET